MSKIRLVYDPARKDQQDSLHWPGSTGLKSVIESLQRLNLWSDEIDSLRNKYVISDKNVLTGYTNPQWLTTHSVTRLTQILEIDKGICLIIVRL